MAIEEIRRFFEPNSVAVVGASRDPEKFGSMILTNLQRLGYTGKLFAVNPYTTEILGIQSFPSVAAIPEKLDVAIIAVPATRVPQIMRDCAQKEVKNAIIISSGFNEAGEVGQETLKETLKIAHEAGIRILGPNTTGIFNMRSRFTTTWAPLPIESKSGPVAFIAQTGMFSAAMLHYIFTAEHFGISKVAGLGNKSDVDETDILEYLYRDEDTRAVMIYMEGIQHGRRFLQAARTFTHKKPIVLLKGGRTPAGAKAALSHTGSRAGQSSLVDALFKASGIISAKNLEEMVDFAKILAYQPLPKGNRVGIASMSGGAAVMASDTVVENGLVVAGVDLECMSHIQKLFPEWAVLTHPIDLEPLMEKVGPDESYRLGLETLLNNPSVDMCLLVIIMFPDDKGNLISTLAPLLRNIDKPVAVSLIGAKQQCEIMGTQLEEMKIPTYLMVSRAAKSLVALSHYARLRMANSS